MTRPELGHDEHERPRDRALYAGLGCMFIGAAVIVTVAPFALGWLP